MKKIVLLIISAVIFSFTACDRVDFEDTNINPQGSYEADMNSLLRGGIMQFSRLTGRVYLTKPALYAQYQSQVVYTSEQIYSDTPGSWSSYYSGILSNFKEVTGINTVTPEGNSDNYHAIAELMSVFIFKRITDTYGDIPYAEALQGGAVNATPAYTAQEEVYKDLIKRAEDARDKLSSSQRPVLESTDPIYGGNLTKWKKFANTLIMSIAIQMSNKDASSSGYAATAFKNAIDNGNLMTSNADNAVFTQDPLNSVVNPYSRLRSNDYRLSKELTDALSGTTGAGSLNPTSNTTNDNRRIKFSADASLTGQPYGYATTDGDGYTRINGSFRGSDSPFVILTSSYTYLLRAEAASAPLSWTSEDATSMLKSGITDSFEQFEATGGATYADARVSDMGTVSGGAKQVINEEIWVASFPDGWNAWANQRRSGYPMLSPAPDAVNGGVIPTRYKYPNEEKNSNTSNYQNGVASLSPAEDNNTSKPWFMN